jgi:hypothetical protein
MIASVAASLAQNVTVIGPITPGDCPQFSSTTVIKDGGFPCNGAPGNAITALTGDVTATGPGSVAATIAANAVTNAKAAQMQANTVKCNPTGSTANAQDCNGGQTEGILQFTQSIGAGVQRLLDKKLQDREIDPDDYGTVDRTGVTDMTSLINTAISAAKSCATGGNSVVRLRAGTYRINGTVVPKSCVTIRGDGRGKTFC